MRSNAERECFDKGWGGVMSEKISLECIKTETTEVFIATPDASITATRWANCEGVNIIMANKDLTHRFSASLRWEEMDALMVAMSAARL